MEKIEEIKNEKVQKIVEQLCAKLHCTELAEDLERLNHAHEMLAKLQQEGIFSQTLPESIKQTAGVETNQIFDPSYYSPADNTNDKESIHSFNKSDDREEEEEEYGMEESGNCKELSNDAWLGFFKGYQILTENQDFCINANKQCIEISPKNSSCILNDYLRSGIRCFMIDLFKGTKLENQQLIFRLHENEFKISREYGFPVVATLFAMLSPRQQYTGMLETCVDYIKLEKDDQITLTTKRIFSLQGNQHKIYVNARFLIGDCKLGDFILMGPTIQLSILEISADELKCLVMEPGILRSRLPVLFPGRCNRNLVSLEELEDITFAREVGINVLVSYIPGTQQYLNDLYETLRLLQCENIRICTRIVLNQIEGYDHEFDWIAERFDGFLIELSNLQQSDACLNYDLPISQPNLLSLSTAAVNLIKKMFEMKKPIILNPLLINERQLFVQPFNIPEIFYYPDKYIFTCQNSKNSFFFYLLQNAISDKIPETELSLQPYCDLSHTGSDSIARSCVAALFESQAKAILVCSSMPNMIIKLSHFRPKVPIIFVTSTKSLRDYISMYHNIVFLQFHAFCENYSYSEFITKGFIYGLIYLKSRKLLKSNENVILVYGSDTATNLPDKYLVYKFDDKNFADNLDEVLFA